MKANELAPGDVFLVVPGRYSAYFCLWNYVDNLTSMHHLGVIVMHMNSPHKQQSQTPKLTQQIMDLTPPNSSHCGDFDVERL